MKVCLKSHKSYKLSQPSYFRILRVIKKNQKPKNIQDEFDLELLDYDKK